MTAQASLALEDKDVPPLEHRIIHHDGSVRWVRNTIVLLKNQAGELYAYNGLIHDVTAQKEAEYDSYSYIRANANLAYIYINSSELASKVKVVDQENPAVFFNTLRCITN